jgi:hypothetical protein
MMGKKPDKTRTQSFWPVLGALLILASGVLAFFLGPVVVDWLDKSNVIRGFPPAGVPRVNLYWILRGIVFVILGLLASLLVAASAPKKKSTVTEVKLIKERQAMVNEKKARKMRQQLMNKQNKGR